MTAWIDCPQCHGTGAAKLSPVYAKTLVLLRKCGASTGAQLARIDGCKATAMNNRLKRLEWHGKVSSERIGREVFYRVAE